MDKKRKNKSKKQSDKIEDLPLFKYFSDQSLNEETPVTETKEIHIDSESSDHQYENEFVEEIKIEEIEISEQSKIDDHNLSRSQAINQLYIPLSYEDAVKVVESNLAKMADFIIPVTDYEKEIIQVVSDIKRSGYLLFLYGVSGVGKSTFISSLEWRKHIPIKKIKSIHAGKLSFGESEAKLNKLFKSITESTTSFFEESGSQDEKLCIIIDYLEILQDEDKKQVKGFFRDLNGLLREYPILIVWPVTDREDLKNMQSLAKTFSSIMFHRRLSALEFSGPPVEVYPDIAKKTIMFFNEGRTCYDFQLQDQDFEDLKNQYKAKKKETQIIREYLKDIIYIWEARTDYIYKIMENIPKPTEVWFVVAYPEAENVVAQFAKSSDVISEMWNADSQRLIVYAKNNQREANWNPQRLTLAVSGVLTTKIMYLPTNTLVSCIASYAQDAEVPITKRDFEEAGVPPHWFRKKPALETLKRSPLYLQLSGTTSTTGKRRSGTVEKSLNKARDPFEKINRTIQEGSDKPFNKALYLALIDAYSDQSTLSFYCEKPHPMIQTIQPDILVEVKDSKYICIEMFYTTKTARNIIAKYVLEKLNTYMNQLGIGRDKIFE